MLFPFLLCNRVPLHCSQTFVENLQRSIFLVLVVTTPPATEVVACRERQERKHREECWYFVLVPSKLPEDIILTSSGGVCYLKGETGQD